MTKRRRPYEGRPLFVDEMLSPSYTLIMRIVYGFKAITIPGKFGKAAQDVDFILKLGKMTSKPILFGCDVKMSRRNVEIDALRTTKLTYVMANQYFVQRTFEDQVWRVLQYWPKIMDEVDKDPDRIFRVDFFSGKIDCKPYL